MHLSTLSPAKTGKRVIATIIDYTFIFTCTFTYVMTFGQPNEEGGMTVSGFAALVPVIGWLMYFVVAEAFFEATFGHYIMGLQVRSADGRMIGFGQAITRRLFDIIEISSCFGLIAFVVAKSNKNGQRLGDLVPRTMVVDCSSTSIMSWFKNAMAGWKTNIDPKWNPLLASPGQKRR